MCSAVLCTSIAEELFIISRLSRPAGRSKRIFTGGVVEENGICSAAFCESAALRGNPFRLLTAFAATFPKGTAFGGGGKVSGRARGSLPEEAGKTVRF